MSSLDQSAPSSALANVHSGRRTRISFASLSLGLCLIVGLLHGLLYVFLAPPWQHYDEPNHFEFTWLAANKSAWPTNADRDPEFERQLVESLVANDFYRGMAVPDLSPGATVRLGLYSQLDERPFYYWLAAAPLRGLQDAPLERQLYASRMVSLGFFLMTILAAWGIARELFPRGKHPASTAPTDLRPAQAAQPGLTSRRAWLLALPLTIALLPGFVDIMTAVNNDTGAVGFFSLFLWGCVRLMRQGLNSWRAVLVLMGTILVGGLAALMKSTALLALPLLALAMVFTLLRGRFRLVGWGLALLFLAAAPFGLLTYGDAFAWHRSTVQEVHTRIRTEQAPVGEYAFLLQPGMGTSPSWTPALFQPLPQAEVARLRGQPVTLGVWAWADRPVDVRSPALWINGVEHVSRLSLDTTPRFFSLAAEAPANTWRVWISLHPGKVAQAEVKVYYDGLVLAEGSRPLSQPPQFDGGGGLYGQWGGIPFTNLARNPSAEQPGLRFQPWVETIGVRLLPDRSHPSLLMTAFLDYSGTGWFFKETGAFLMRTWWGRFGWGHVPLIGAKPYRWLGLLTAVAIMGGLAALWRGRQRIHWPAVAFLGVVLVAAWGAAFLRGSIYLGLPRLLWSPARYAAPAIIPTATILVGGSLQVLAWIPGLRTRPAVQLAVYLTLLIALGLASIYTLAAYYY